MENDNVLNRDTEPIGSDLGEAGLLPLPVRSRARDHCHLSGDLDPDATPFPSTCGHGLGRTERTNLNVGGKTDPKKPARLPSRISLLEEIWPIRELPSLIERGLIIAAVVLEPRRGLERELGWFRHVFQAHLYRIETEFACHEVHDAFNDVCCLGPPSTAVRVGRHLVGVDTGNLHLHGLELVAAAEHYARQRWDRGREKLAIRTDVDYRLTSNCEHRAILLDRNLVVPDLVTPVNRGCRVFAPALDPLDRPIEAYREVTDNDLFGVQIEL